MTDHPIESEAKFTCPSRAVGDVMRIHRLGVLLRVEDQQQRYTDTYLDTQEHSLHRQGSALRLRANPLGRLLATYKGPPLGADPAISQRVEVESQIEDGDFSIDRPQPIGLFQELPAFAAARELLGDVMLQPIARVVTNSRAMIFRATGGESVELAIDRVAGVREPDQQPQQFIEVELELIEGDLAIFQDVLDDLQRQAPELRPSATTKLERVLAERN